LSIIELLVRTHLTASVVLLFLLVLVIGVQSLRDVVAGLSRRPVQPSTRAAAAATAPGRLAGADRGSPLHSSG
jgi:hypothetical protein